jgi:UDP-3-O-[3-hydroxymyristoyl] glucosamine N-acyltransferase
MADSRFFTNHGPLSLQQIINLTDTKPHTSYNPEQIFSDVTSLDNANSGSISFLDNTKYVELFKQSKAGACFAKAKYVEHAPKDMLVLVSDDPYRAYALTAQTFYPLPSDNKTNISEHAHIDPTANIGNNVTIEPGAVIEANAEIGDHSTIHAHAVIMRGVKIGTHCQIGSHTILSHCLIGNKVIIHRSTHIGQDGFGYAMGAAGHEKVPQLGRVLIEGEVEIGSGCCIDRGAGPDTIIGQGTKIDNLVQIGHNVMIGKQCVIVSQVGIAGSTKLGDGVVVGGQAGLAGHLDIGSGVQVAAQSGVMSNIQPKSIYGGSPAIPIKDWHRQTLTLAKMINPTKKSSRHG